jgi:hypothetical protein
MLLEATRQNQWNRAYRVWFGGTLPPLYSNRSCRQAQVNLALSQVAESMILREIVGEKGENEVYLYIAKRRRRVVAARPGRLRRSGALKWCKGKAFSDFVQQGR